MLEITQSREALRRCRGAEVDQPRNGAGRFPGAGRAVGLRQVHAAQLHRRARRDVSGGKIVIGGRDVTQVPPRDRDIAMVFQSYALYPTMTVAENIAFGMKVRHVPQGRAGQQDQARSPAPADRAAARAQARRTLGRPAPARRHGPGAGARADAVPVRRAALATSTPSCASSCAARSSGCTSGSSASIVYVTHDQIEAMTLGTGRRAQPGRDPADRHAARNLRQAGQSVRRRLHGLAADEPASPAASTYANGNATITFNGGQRLTIPNAPPSSRRYHGKDVTFGIRPEALRRGSTLSGPVHLVENSGLGHVRHVQGRRPQHHRPLPRPRRRSITTRTSASTSTSRRSRGSTRRPG